MDAELAKLLAMLDCVAPPSPGGLTIERLKSYIRNRISSPSDLADMASHFGVSKGYLCRRVGELSGQSPMKLLTGEKMSWARELLNHGGFTIAEVADRVGFADANYFSKAFKKHFGRSPRSFLPD